MTGSRNTALKSEGRSARTYTVCVGSLVVGYYCLATGSIRRDAAPKNLSRNTPDPIPVIIIGRLAVDKHFERQGIGGGMLADAFRRIAQASETVGCGAVLVHAIDQEAVEFYVRWGFAEYPGKFADDVPADENAAGRILVKAGSFPRRGRAKSRRLFAGNDDPQSDFRSGWST